ncbi:MAG: hypothetical protein ACOC1K_01730 [Nanoarchaeota archaeon]
MKIIKISGYGDYGAKTFEENFNKKDYLDLWKQANNQKDNKLTLEVGKYNEEIYVEAFQFKEVDKEFISHIRNNYMDYDNMKHTNFYIVKEEK